MCNVPGTAEHVMGMTASKATHCGRRNCYHHFVEEETEARSGDMTNPEQADGRETIQAKAQEAGKEVRL